MRASMTLNFELPRALRNALVVRFNFEMVTETAKFQNLKFPSKSGSICGAVINGMDPPFIKGFNRAKHETHLGLNKERVQ